nr:hypothetical protein [Tanacetum cinerariifolium]
FGYRRYRSFAGIGSKCFPDDITSACGFNVRALLSYTHLQSL